MDVFLKKMRNIKIEDAICVKITIYKDYHADEVIYYRNKLPARIVSKWRWYFEYVAARVKVSNPRRKVELFIGPQTLLQGQEYIDARRATLLQAKKIEDEATTKYANQRRFILLWTAGTG